MMRKLILSLCALGISAASMAAEMNVAVSVLPEKYFVEQIGGDNVKVDVIVPPGSEPETYAVKAEQMKNLAQADVYFTMDVPFERAWLPRIASNAPQMRIVPLNQRICRREWPAGVGENAHNPNPQQGKDCVPVNPDPHTWMSPDLVRIMAGTIRDTLIQQDPDNAAQYRENYRNFVAHVDNIDLEILDALKGIKTHQFMVFHPAFGYFARAYGLQQLPIQMHGTNPTPKQLADIISLAKQEDIKVIFVQPQFSERAAQTIADQVGAELVSVDPLAENWGENMVKVAQTFASALQK